MMSELHGTFRYWTMVYWGDENLSCWSDFIFVTCSVFFQCRLYLPPPGWLYELSQEPGGTMQVVSFKKMHMRTTRRLEVRLEARSGTTFCCLAIVNCWTWERGSVAAFRWPQFCRKHNRFGSGSLFAMISMFRACCILIVPFTRDNCPHRCTPFHGFWWTVVSVHDMQLRNL